MGNAGDVTGAAVGVGAAEVGKEAETVKKTIEPEGIVAELFIICT